MGSRNRVPTKNYFAKVDFQRNTMYSVFRFYNFNRTFQARAFRHEMNSSRMAVKNGPRESGDGRRKAQKH